jgi:hypothetical protein
MVWRRDLENIQALFTRSGSFHTSAMSRIFWRWRGLIVPKVLGGLGNSLAVETNDNAAEIFIAVGDIEVDLNTHKQPLQLHAAMMQAHTLWVILGPFVASEACAKKTKATERIRRKEITNLWMEAMVTGCGALASWGVVEF